MAFEELIRSMETAAAAKKQETLEKAEEEVREILVEAKERAGEITRRYLEEARRSTGQERTRQLFQVRTEISRHVSAAREELLKSAMKTASERFSAFRDDPVYPEKFQQYLVSVLNGLAGEEIVLHVDPADEVLCERIIAQLGISCRITPDIRCMGGLVAGSADDAIRAENTIESRLTKAAEEFAPDLYQLLGG